MSDSPDTTLEECSGCRFYSAINGDAWGDGACMKLNKRIAGSSDPRPCQVPEHIRVVLQWEEKQAK